MQSVSLPLMNRRFITYRFIAGTCLKPLSVFLMSLLLFLTALNYFVYSNGKAETGIENAMAGTDDSSNGLPGVNPSGPDEKSADAPVSLTEEFIHKHTELSDPFWINCYFKYIVADSEKLHVTHFEIVSPPPDSLV